MHAVFERCNIGLHWSFCLLHVLPRILVSEIIFISPITMVNSGKERIRERREKGECPVSSEVDDGRTDDGRAARKQVSDFGRH